VVFEKAVLGLTSGREKLETGEVMRETGLLREDAA
jgi:hypothetical protein